MPRNGSGVYSLPAGSTVVNGDTSDATDINTPLADLATDQNTVRPIVAGGTGASSAASARTNLGLVIGTDVQAYDADLTAIAALTSAADKMLYATGAGTWALADLTAAGRALLDDASAAAQLTTMGAQTADATLTSLSGLSLAQGDVLYATAADTLARLPKGTAGQALVMNAGATAPEWVTAAVGGAELKASTSGTNIDFTDIPATATEVTLMFLSTSYNGAPTPLVQIGDSGGFESTGYVSGSANSSSNNTRNDGFHAWGTSASPYTFIGKFVLTLADASTNTWSCTVNLADSIGDTSVGGGEKALSATLDRLRVTSAEGRTFDGGSLAIRWR